VPPNENLAESDTITIVVATGQSMGSPERESPLDAYCLNVVMPVESAISVLVHEYFKCNNGYERVSKHWWSRWSNKDIRRAYAHYAQMYASQLVFAYGLQDDAERHDIFARLVSSWSKLCEAL
jgi:hypothetical protein